MLKWKPLPHISSAFQIVQSDNETEHREHSHYRSPKRQSIPHCPAPSLWPTSSPEVRACWLCPGTFFHSVIYPAKQFSDNIYTIATRICPLRMLLNHRTAYSCGIFNSPKPAPSVVSKMFEAIRVRMRRRRYKAATVFAALIILLGLSWYLGFVSNLGLRLRYGLPAGSAPGGFYEAPRSSKDRIP